MWTLDRRAIAPRLVAISTLVMLAAACSGGSSSILSTVGDVDRQPGRRRRVRGSVGGPGRAPDGLTGSGGQPGTDDGGSPPSALRDDLKIVYTGSLQLVVGDLEAALAKAKAAVTRARRLRRRVAGVNDGDRSVATITYRIPAARWDDTVSGAPGPRDQGRRRADAGDRGRRPDRRHRGPAEEPARERDVAPGDRQGDGQGQRPARGPAAAHRRPRPDRRARRPADAARGPGRLRHARDDVRARDRAVQETAKGGIPRATSTARRRPSGRPDVRQRGDLVRDRVAAAAARRRRDPVIARVVVRRVAPAQPGGPVPGWAASSPARGPPVGGLRRARRPWLTMTPAWQDAPVTDQEARYDSIAEAYAERGRRSSAGDAGAPRRGRADVGPAPGASSTSAAGRARSPPRRSAAGRRSTHGADVSAGMLGRRRTRPGCRRRSAGGCGSARRPPTGCRTPTARSTSP